MPTQEESKSPPKSQLMLHRVYVKSSSFESTATTLASIQSPVQPAIDMQVFANVYPQSGNIHEAVLGLKITAKHNGNLLWRVQIEEAGFYTLEGFSKEQETDILNGFCMNQLYTHAGAVVTQMVTQGSFLPAYLQPMDFNQLYQEKKKENAQQGSVKAAATTLDESRISSEQAIN